MVDVSKRVERRVWFCALLIIAVFIAGFALFDQLLAQRGIDCECIEDEPLQFIAGRIKIVGGGVFSGGVLTYQLGSAGKRRKSGEACKCWYRVTESKYNRVVDAFDAIRD